MKWKVEVKPAAERQYLKLGGKTRGRIIAALREIERAENPLLHRNVRPLTGQLKGDFRIRIGDYRILFTPDREEKVIYVYAILPRGEAY
jgi:mRNA interferase RelE/StbE